MRTVHRRSNRWVWFCLVLTVVNFLCLLYGRRREQIQDVQIRALGERISARVFTTNYTGSTNLK